MRTWRRKAKEEKEKEMLLFDWNFRCWLYDRDAHCSSSLSQTIPKPLIMLSQNEKKRKLKSTSQWQIRSLLQKLKRKRLQKARRDDPRKHKPEKENRRESKNYKKEISLKLQNQNKQDDKNLKERCKKSTKKKKRRRLSLQKDRLVNIYGNYSLFS